VPPTVRLPTLITAPGGENRVMLFTDANTLTIHAYNRESAHRKKDTTPAHPSLPEPDANLCKYPPIFMPIIISPTI
jgi:hypothetical protein